MLPDGTVLAAHLLKSFRVRDLATLKWCLLLAPSDVRVRRALLRPGFFLEFTAQGVLATLKLGLLLAPSDVCIQCFC